MPHLTFLGTGTSNGIPMIGCTCPVCLSSDPRDRRSRTSAVVRWDERTYLIDTATELRLQAIEAGLDAVDAVLMTHAHADHTGGFDDLRRFNELAQARIPVYAATTTADVLRERFAYAFTHEFPFYGGKPDLDLFEVSDSFRVFEHTITPIPVLHGRTSVLGFRFGDLAYVTDAKTISDASMALLDGVDTLVINALRERPHPTHLSIADALGVIERLQPRQAFLVHVSHELSHERGSALLPPGVAIAYDGLTIASASAEREQPAETGRRRSGA
jgi:phosphoribosyl 1,2-cyclic phosphate phosphodiesterase